MMCEDLLRQTAVARARLQSAIAETEDVAWPSALEEADVVVTFNEVNHQHGTGVLVRNLFGEGEGIVSVRSANLYRRKPRLAGELKFGVANHCLGRLGLKRRQIFSRVLHWFRGIGPRRVLCIPYEPDDVLLAIAIKEVFDVPMCLYVMDDRNVSVQGIPDSLLHEAVDKSAVLFAVSPEMRDAYSTKFGRPFWLLPPLVRSSLLDSAGVHSVQPGRPLRGILAGNIWSQKWLENLRATVRHVDCAIDWFSNVPDAAWLHFDAAELAQDHLLLRAGLPEEELARVVGEYDFAVVPSGDLDDGDDLRWIAHFSLPTKIPFVLATGHVPLVVFGNGSGAAGQFVERFHVGFTCPYDAGEFQNLVTMLADPERQQEMRDTARKLASAFSNEGAADWLWAAVDLGRPPDERYEMLMPRRGA